MVELTDLSFLQSTEIMVPFLFTFAVTFGVLELTRVFRNKGVNLIIALALSIFAISSPTFINLLWNYFGNITIFFIAMFLIAFTLESFGLRRAAPDTGGAIVIQSAVLFLLLTIGFYYSDRMPVLPIVGGGQNALLLFAVILILSIFWSVYRMQQIPHVRQPQK